MNTSVSLDVLVVYSADLALSASVPDTQSKYPFALNRKQANYNPAYAYFLASCQRRGLRAGLTTSADIIGPGRCQSYWTFSAGKWHKKAGVARTQHIFDKISPRSPIRRTERELLFSDKRVKPFNDSELFTLFYDKLQTHQKLASVTIPTVSIRSSQLTDIEIAIAKLKKLVSALPGAADFSTELILKDRFGAGGNHVYKIDGAFASKIQKIARQYPKIRFVLQPFLRFDAGYAYKNNQTATDIRLIFQNNQLLQSYIRMAKIDDFRCNEHQGGQLVYITKKDIPTSIREMSHSIVEQLDRTQSLYALDFVVSNSGQPYLLEGNIGPGVDWDPKKKQNEDMSKALIRAIVDEVTNRVNASVSSVEMALGLGAQPAFNSSR